MTHRARVTRVMAAVLMLSLVGQALVLEHVNRLRPNATLEEVLYMPSARTVRFLSLGYTGLMADIYWTRAVQYFGRKHLQNSLRYDLLYPLLDITTQLDPKLIVAYKYGSVFLSQPPPQGAGQPDKAAEFVERGIRENPDAWDLWAFLGYIHFLERHDYEAAEKAFDAGSKVPGAKPWLKTMAAMMARRAGNLEAARYLWQNIYASTDDKELKKNAAQRLVALDIDEAVPQLESLVFDYNRRFGHVPMGWRDLINAGMIRGVPLDPTGKPFKIDISGKVYVENPDDFPFITEGLPPGKQPTRFTYPAELH